MTLQQQADAILNQSDVTFEERNQVQAVGDLIVARTALNSILQLAEKASGNLLDDARLLGAINAHAFCGLIRSARGSELTLQKGRV